MRKPAAVKPACASVTVFVEYAASYTLPKGTSHYALRGARRGREFVIVGNQRDLEIELEAAKIEVDRAEHREFIVNDHALGVQQPVAELQDRHPDFEKVFVVGLAGETHQARVRNARPGRFAHRRKIAQSCLYVLGRAIAAPGDVAALPDQIHLEPTQASPRDQCVELAARQIVGDDLGAGETRMRYQVQLHDPSPLDVVIRTFVSLWLLVEQRWRFDAGDDEVPKLSALAIKGPDVPAQAGIHQREGHDDPL